MAYTVDLSTKCAICCSELGAWHGSDDEATDNQMVTRFPCGHWFHTVCATRPRIYAIADDDGKAVDAGTDLYVTKCPLCRQEVRDDEEEFRMADVIGNMQEPAQEIAVVRPYDVIPTDNNVVLADFFGCAILGDEYLDIYKGETVLHIQPPHGVDPAGWQYGMTVHGAGWFPPSFVGSDDDKYPDGICEGPEIGTYHATKDFQAECEWYINLEKGDIVLRTSHPEDDGEWAFGVSKFGWGWFPLMAVEAAVPTNEP